MMAEFKYCMVVASSSEASVELSVRADVIPLRTTVNRALSKATGNLLGCIETVGVADGINGGTELGAELGRKLGMTDGIFAGAKILLG
mmetsp:Transcript_17383/g.25896  ORF Transcript_17383/g.25896 Transcript_17383/m.25896 type:complete len:88 (+) Transcript_17383:167-430(+)